MPDKWLNSLITKNPQTGFYLTIKLSRMAVKMTQPDDDMRKELWTIYDKDANALIVSFAVVATNFQTIAIANNYWKEIE